jgi:hypothetical protein
LRDAQELGRAVVAWPRISCYSVTLAMMIGGVDINTVKRRKRYRAVAG